MRREYRDALLQGNQAWGYAVKDGDHALHSASHFGEATFQEDVSWDTRAGKNRSDVDPRILIAESCALCNLKYEVAFEARLGDVRSCKAAKQLNSP